MDAEDYNIIVSGNSNDSNLLLNSGQSQINKTDNLKKVKSLETKIKDLEKTKLDFNDPNMSVYKFEDINEILKNDYMIFNGKVYKNIIIINAPPKRPNPENIQEAYNISFVILDLDNLKLIELEIPFSLYGDKFNMVGCKEVIDNYLYISSYSTSINKEIIFKINIENIINSIKNTNESYITLDNKYMEILLETQLSGKKNISNYPIDSGSYAAFSKGDFIYFYGANWFVGLPEPDGSLSEFPIIQYNYKTNTRKLINGFTDHSILNMFKFNDYVLSYGYLITDGSQRLAKFNDLENIKDFTILDVKHRINGYNGIQLDEKHYFTTLGGNVLVNPQVINIDTLDVVEDYKNWNTILDNIYSIIKIYYNEPLSKEKFEEYITPQGGNPETDERDIAKNNVKSRTYSFIYYDNHIYCLLRDGHLIKHKII